MDTLKEQFEAIEEDINDNEYDSNEEIAVKQQMLQEIYSRYDEKSLFKILSSPTFAYVSIDDKIVAMFNVEQYDVKRFEKAQKKRGLTDSGALTDFKNMIFDNIKKLLVLALNKLKELVEAKFDEFAKMATDALAKFLKEQGIKLLEKIVDKVRNGEKVENVEVKVDGQKQPLKCVLNKTDCKKIALLAKEIDDIYDSTYEKVNEKVERIKDGEDVDEIVEEFEEENKEESEDSEEESGESEEESDEEEITVEEEMREKEEKEKEKEKKSKSKKSNNKNKEDKEEKQTFCFCF